MPPSTTETMAEVKFTKMKECPMLTAGKITPISHQAWSLACKRYLKHGGKTAAEVVSFVAEGMMEPRLIQWYQASQVRIDALTLDQYLDELAGLTLDRNWAHTLREEILNSHQGSRAFIDWKIEMENLNSILVTSAPTKALTAAALKVQLEARLNADLRLSLSNEPVLSTELAPWSIEVKERDDRLKFEEDRTQRIFERNTASISAARFAKKSLASRLSDPPSPSSNTARNTATSSGSNKAHTATQLTQALSKLLPKLTDAERALLRVTEHDGCFRCRLFYAGHRSSNCPNSWPNAATYKPLTQSMALAAAPASVKPAITTGAALANTDSEEERDYDTSDTYVPMPVPFTVPHLYASFEVTGPLIEDFPVPVKALLDIGCPSTVISDALVAKLGLRRFVLPIEEDNLSSLSESPLRCSEYVKLEVSSGKGSWKSKVHRAKVNVGLPVPLILGMPFLSSEHIVIDSESRTAIDKRVNYNLISPTLPKRIWAPDRVTPPPTPKKPRKAKRITLENAPTPSLDGHLLPPQIMAAVRERMEAINLQEILKKKDAEMKLTYADRFPRDLPNVNLDEVPNHIYHRIRLKDPTKVVRKRGYAAPKIYLERWEQLLKRHLDSGRLRPSSSEYSSPSFCVPKYRNGVPDHTIEPRWVNDFREINGNTIRDSYPLPIINDILAACGSGKYFAKIDMTNSFLQTRVHPDDIHLTAIRTPWGLYEWTVMPMGGSNAPATHQRRMTDALRHLIGKICHVYLDDIIIWSQTLEEHEENVAKVLEALRAAKLYCNPDKSTLFATEISFLGHVISASGISADPRKTDKVWNWPQPRTSLNVRGFLGLTRYLSAFLPALAEHTSVLTPLTNKECDKVFPVWTDAHQRAFEAIKRLVTGTDCLTVIDYNDPTKKIFLTTDASDRRTGAILSFGDTWETARPVAYDSYQLNPAEKNYPVHEKELLAIVKALKKWRGSLLGVPFKIYTDHRTLEYFQSQKDMSRRQSRWSMLMADFDYEIIYIRGEDNSAADALSRMPDEEPSAAFAACALARTRSPHPNPLLSAATLTVSADESLLTSIKDNYATDNFCKQLLEGIRAGSITGAHEENGLLYVGGRLVIPRELKVRELLYHLAHDTLGHFGFDKSYESLRNSYYWPNMRRDLEVAYIPSCSECQRNKDRTTRPTGPLHPLPVPDNRFDSVALDFIGPLPEEDGKDTILTMTDNLGADIQLIPIHSSYTAEQVAATFFDEWYCENGLMRHLISDRDALFTSALWEALHKLTGVKLKMSTAYHPETDGASERTNKTLNQMVRYHVEANQKGWSKNLSRIRFAIMNTVNASTGFTPFQLKTGRSPRIIPPLVPDSPSTREASDAEITARDIIQQLELDVKEAQDHLLAAKVRQAYHANQHRGEEVMYEEGSLVMLSTKNRRRNYKKKGQKRVAKFMPRFDGPYTVVKAFPEKSEYTLRLPNNPKTFPGFHASLLKPHIPNDPDLFPDREFKRPGAIVTEDGMEENYIDKIVDERIRGRGKQYLVRWVGFGKDHDEWLSGKMLQDNEALDIWECNNPSL